MIEFRAPEVLTPEHDVSNFDCGKAPLNQWLQLNALDKQNVMLSRTYVVTSDAVVASFHTLARNASFDSSHFDGALCRRREFSRLRSGTLAFHQRFAAHVGRKVFGSGAGALFSGRCQRPRLQKILLAIRYDPRIPDTLRLYLFYKTLRQEFGLASDVAEYI